MGRLLVGSRQLPHQAKKSKPQKESKKIFEEGVDVISGVLEWGFDCDKASKEARETFDKTMDRGWLLEHGISPFDIDAAWEEVMKRLSDLKEACVLTVVRITEPNPRWDLFQENLIKGNEK